VSLKLAIVSNRYPRDGDDTASPFVHHVCQALVDRGVDLKVLTPRYSGGPDQDPWVTRFDWAESDRVFGQLSLRNPADIRKILQGLKAGRAATTAFLSDFKPDFALALWALPSGWWLMHSAGAADVPYAVWCLGSDIQLWGRRWGVRGLIRRILRGASGVFADGYALADDTAALSGRTCEFLPTMRPLAAGLVTHPDVRLPEEPYFLYYGRLCRDKGVVDLLDAVAMLPDASPVRVVLAGVAEPGFDAAGRIELRNVSRRCTLLGELTPDRLTGCVRQARAVVLPSHRDSIPLVLGESIQLGTPVLCSDLPDLCQLLARYQLGSVFKGGSPEALCRALQCYKPPPRFSSEAARFLADFSPARSADQILAKAADVLGRPLEHSAVAPGKGVPCA
jgi:glycosyltransferase involved in cell wall biosynthesis